MQAPVGGWNARDKHALLLETDARELLNFWPTAEAVSVRSGYAAHIVPVPVGLQMSFDNDDIMTHDDGSIMTFDGDADDQGVIVETIAPWYGESGASHLVAIVNGSLLAVTTVPGVAIDTTPRNSSKWQWTNYKNRLFLVDGEDPPLDYDGTDLTETAWTGPADTSLLVNVWVYKARLMFAESESASFWYPALAGAVTGDLVEFDLGQFTERGGYLMAGGTYSRDAGDGLDDYLVLVMSTGEVFIYGGVDPGDDLTMVGRYQVGRPMGRRCLTKIGGDLVILTHSGIIPVSLILSGDITGVIDVHPVWGKIRPATVDAARLYGATPGWELVHNDDAGVLICSVPIVQNTVYDQHVQNTLTGAWARWDIAATTWCEFRGKLFFAGADGVVYEMGAAKDDAGTPISARARGSYSYFQDPRRKHAHMSKPVISSSGPLQYTMVLEADYADSGPLPALQALPVSVTGTLWGKGKWGTFKWGSTRQGTLEWVETPAVGRAFSPVLILAAANSDVKWYATDVLYSHGGAR